MTVLELINNIAMVVLISLAVMSGALVIIRGIGEEKRKTAEHVGKILDQTFDKLPDTTTKTAEKVTKYIEGEQQKKEMQAWARMKNSEKHDL